MQATREIYWNIGSSAIIPMYLMSFLALGILVWGVIRQIKILSLGQPEDRSGDVFKRLLYILQYALLQIKVRRKDGVGRIHSLFFWGFMLLLLGTTLIFIQADILDPFFGITFLKGTFYKIYSLTLDVAGLFATLMIIGFAARRYIVKPKGMTSKDGDLIALLLLLVIMITGYLIEGLRMATTELSQQPELAKFSPVGLVTAKMFYLWGEHELRNLHAGIWWFHMCLVMCFIAIIPFTRLKHLILIPINLYNTNLGPKGRLKTLDLEDESQETFGVAKVTDLSWKDLFDSEACLSCSRCQELCPAYNTDKPLSPMKVIQDINFMAHNNQEGSLTDQVSRSALWACTTCRACQSNCPADVEHVPKIIDMRRNLVLMEGEFPGEEVAQAMDQMEVNFNPLGSAFASRGDWASELNLPQANEATDLDYLYFVGCYGSFDARNIQISKNLIQLCEKAGLKIGILGKGEKCCGEPARKMGNEYLYQSLATENVEAIQKTGAKKIITTCPHCMDTLGNQYPDFGLDVEVIHYTTLLNELAKDGSLPLEYKKSDDKITYHDSCYLGRYNDNYESPRELLNQGGVSIVEMENCKESSFCCGGGGGRILAEEKTGTRINQTRVQMAKDTGADVVVSNCPFCLTMMEDGIKGAGLEEGLKAQDLTELLLQRIK